MAERLRINIGDIIFDLNLPAAHLKTLLQSRYEPFLTDRAAIWQVTLTYDPSLKIENEPWIHHKGARTHFEIAGHTGWIDLDTREAVVSTPSDALAHSAVERVMAFVCMQELPRYHNALLLHGAGIVINGKGYVFFGASGRGKSTVSRLARARGQVLTDENVIIRLTPSGAELASTPFWGFGTPLEDICRIPYQQVPLLGLYSLVHAPDFTLTALPPAAAVMELLTSEKVATERAASATAWLAMADRIIKEVPIYRLGFRPTLELWEFLALGQERMIRSTDDS
ncbi:MAG: hypothetical protein H0T73_16390 [Ardenticatenales bacterium]|nr:hypothetical protein [Ardenticatenales bacterium]